MEIFKMFSTVPQKVLAKVLANLLNLSKRSSGGGGCGSRARGGKRSSKSSQKVVRSSKGLPKGPRYYVLYYPTLNKMLI